VDDAGLSAPGAPQLELGTAQWTLDEESGDAYAVEPFLSARDETGRLRNLLTPEALMKASAIAAGLGTTSAYTWLKVPVVDDLERALAATTLPVLLLGGEVAADQDAQFASWQKALGADNFSINVRYEHEHADLRASCTLGLIGGDGDPGCGRYRLNELRAAARYTLRDRIGVTLSAFDLYGSRNANVFQGNGRPDSDGLMGQVDYTLWPDGKGPLGPLFNARVGLQYTVYGKFNGQRHNFDGAGANAADNNALRLFTWIAF